MAFELKEDQCTIFKNEHKKDEKHPDYKGSIKINGEVKEIALWVKTSQKGVPYFSGKISEKRQQPQRTPNSFPPQSDGMPF